MKIHAYRPEYLDPVVTLSLRAWEPVFDSLNDHLEPDVYDHFYPDGWRVSQRKDVSDACKSDDFKTWVALDSRLPGDPEVTVAGFVSIRLDTESQMGEIYMIAVDPDFQKRGIAKTLSQFAFEQMKEAGMKVAMVDTGGDPGHAPARATYESIGFKILPVARYFRKL